VSISYYRYPDAYDTSMAVAVRILDTKFEAGCRIINAFQWMRHFKQVPKIVAIKPIYVLFEWH
jgi:hypothetical protein